MAQLRGEVAYSDHDRELFGELPIEADRGALLNLVGPIGRFGLQDIDTELLPESVRAVAAQLQAAGSQVAAEEWLYLATNSWLAARSRRIFDAFNQAGAAALELGRDVLGDVIHRTLQLPSDAPPVLRPELIARAGLRWLAVGGPAIAPLLFPQAWPPSPRSSAVGTCCYPERPNLKPSPEAPSKVLAADIESGFSAMPLGCSLSRFVPVWPRRA